MMEKIKRTERVKNEDELKRVNGEKEFYVQFKNKKGQLTVAELLLRDVQTEKENQLGDEFKCQQRKDTALRRKKGMSAPKKKYFH